MHKELLKNTITIVDKYSTPRDFVEEYFIKNNYTSSRTLSQIIHLFWHGWFLMSGVPLLIYSFRVA
jgi:hypothetical protein